MEVCSIGKMTYPCRGEALSALRERRGHSVARKVDVHGVEAFQCGRCGMWHLGHPKPKTVMRKLAKRRRDEWERTR